MCLVDAVISGQEKGEEQQGEHEVEWEGRRVENEEREKEKE